MAPPNCPSCGAPVKFKSTASIMVVCPYCRATLLKDADSVSNLGKMSDVLEDYSPLQIGTSGRFASRSFSLIGRIQLQYAAGFWNEWYALFDDGTHGWLSDASGQFTMTFDRSVETTLPFFDKLKPGYPLILDGQTYTTSDVRTARCTAGQGELPFRVGPGWEAKVADFRCGDGFLSLDYSDTGAVKIYGGSAVEIAALNPQFLRDVDRINESAGRFRGKVTAFKCPACGAPVACAPGVTVHIVCPSCGSGVDVSGAIATVLNAGAVVERVRFTLELGSEALIDGFRYTLLGGMRRTESDDAPAWSEYLLYAPGRKFIWLIETHDGWQRGEVLDRWPLWDGVGHAMLDQRRFNQSAEYVARVGFAAGSFNWRVKIGDTVRVSEFDGGGLRLAAEASDEELTWSRSVPVALDQVRAWFGAQVHSTQQPHPKYRDSARRILSASLLINAIPLLFAPGSTLPYALFGAAAIYLPAYYLDRLESGGQ